jgi:hypothetical protein
MQSASLGKPVRDAPADDTQSSARAEGTCVRTPQMCANLRARPPRTEPKWLRTIRRFECSGFKAAGVNAEILSSGVLPQRCALVAEVRPDDAAGSHGGDDSCSPACERGSRALNAGAGCELEAYRLSGRPRGRGARGVHKFDLPARIGQIAGRIEFSQGMPPNRSPVAGGRPVPTKYDFQLRFVSE